MWATCRRDNGVKGGVAGLGDTLEVDVADVTKGLLVLGQVMRSTWWDWTNGSSPLFWRWNGTEQCSAARDGMHIFVRSPLPRSQWEVKLPRFKLDVRKAVASKIDTMIGKSYLEVD